MRCMYATVPNNIIFRSDPSLKARAERVAAVRDETVSQVLRRALREYVTTRRICHPNQSGVELRADGVQE